MSTFSADDLLLAPLAGYTDLPFRRSCRRQGLRLAYTALIDAGALVYGNDENEAILARGDDEPWLGVQLLGSRLELLEAAAPRTASVETAPGKGLALWRVWYHPKKAKGRKA